MIKHFPQTLTLSLAGIFLALASQSCLAGEGTPTAVELANATYTGTEEGPVTLAGDQLKEGDAMITGKLSLATLAGTEWVLTHFDRNEAIQEGAEVTLVFSDDKISGKSACNRYSAGVEQGEAPGDLKIGLAMGTRMACPGELMDLESKYLDALSRVTGFSFLAGKLVLTWEKDGNWLSMVFTPR